MFTYEGSSTMPSDSLAIMTPMKLGHVIRKRKFHILAVFGLTVGIVALGTFFAKPTYEATAKILIRLSRENIYVPTPGGSNAIVKIDREGQINTEIQILNSRLVAEKVVESLGPLRIYPDLAPAAQPGVGSVSHATDVTPVAVQNAASRLQKHLTIEAVRLSDVIKVKFQHTDPSLAATVLNTLVNVFLEHHLEVYKTPRSHEFFLEQAQMMKDKLSQAEENLRAFKKQHHLTSLEEQRQLLLKNEADILAGLHQTQSQEAETAHRLKQLQAQLAILPKATSLGSESETNLFALNNLKQKLVDLELKERELLAQYTAHHPLVQNIKTQLHIVRQELTAQEATRHHKTRTEVNPVYQTLQQEYFRNEAELQALRARKASQQAQLTSYQQKLQNFSHIESEFNILQEEVKFKRQHHQLYLTQLEESRISDAMDKEKITGVSMIESARAPLEPASPNKRLNLILAVFLGTFGGLGLAFFLEYLEASQPQEASHEPALHVPVLASMSE